MHRHDNCDCDCGDNSFSLYDHIFLDDNIYDHPEFIDYPIFRRNGDSSKESKKSSGGAIRSWNMKAHVFFSRAFRTVFIGVPIAVAAVASIAVVLYMIF